MSLRATEAISETGTGLDRLPRDQMASHLVAAQKAALHALNPALADITLAADAMARAIADGRSLYYGAAGSSGLMAAADALELPGTFGLDPDRIHILMAGGQPNSSRMPGGTEDDTDQAQHMSTPIRAGDCVIVATASGSTPFALTLAKAARVAGAVVIGLSNTAGAALFDHADIAICLETPPEPLAGSTRLGAGTAQKVALNTMSTMMAVNLGHVHDGMMVNLRVDNKKLRNRATRIVATISGVTSDVARGLLTRVDYAVKPAILLAAGCANRAQAEEMLRQSNGHLRAALARL